MNIGENTYPMNQKFEDMVMSYTDNLLKKINT